MQLLLASLDSPPECVLHLFEKLYELFGLSGWRLLLLLKFMVVDFEAFIGLLCVERAVAVVGPSTGFGECRHVCVVARKSLFGGRIVLFAI